MAIRTMQLGGNEDVLMWDDEETPYAIVTDAPINSPSNSQTEAEILLLQQSVGGLQQSVAILQQTILTLEGQVAAIEATLATGVGTTFTTVDNKTVTVVGGLITSVS